MKRLFLIGLLITTFLTSCGSSDNNKKDDTKAEAITSDSTVNEKTFVKTLSYNSFIKNVWDINANANEFIFKGDRPCVIDFYATWCGPCKTIAPILEKLAREYDGKVDFYKVDTDKEQKLAMVLQIKYLPTVFFVNGDAQPEKSVGGKDEEFFRSHINKLLGE